MRSILKNQMMQSPLANQSIIRPKGNRGRKSLVITLVLTSLVDAFCMLVIYLMFNISPSEQASMISKAGQLPIASHSDTLERGTVVRVEGDKYFVNEQAVAPQNLTQKFQQIKAQMGQAPDILIQADKSLNFSAFNPIILAAAQSGVHQFKFAVFHGGNGK